MSPVAMLRRECRYCGRSSNVAFSYDACPWCHKPFGRLELGMDRADQQTRDSAEGYAPVAPDHTHRPVRDEDGIKRCAVCRQRTEVRR